MEGGRATENNSSVLDEPHDKDSFPFVDLAAQRLALNNQNESSTPHHHRCTSLLPGCSDTTSIIAAPKLGLVFA